MIESLFILLVILAFMLMVLAVAQESKIYAMMSVVVWIIVFAQSLWIEVPGCDDGYTEYGFSALSTMFIFAMIVYALVLQFDWRRYLK